MIILIAAIGKNNALGLNNDMLWHLPEDFRHFKTKTTGHTIIMGRKTLESLPGILPNRKHIVITRNKTWEHKQVETVHSVEEALKLADSPKYIIGGGEIFKAFLPYADILELTRVDQDFHADVFFPSLDFEQWVCTSSEQRFPDERHAFPYRFETWERKKYL